MSRSQFQTFVYFAIMIGTVLGFRDPYSTIQAESFDTNIGAEIKPADLNTATKYFYIHSGDVIGYQKLNFSEETIAFHMLMRCHDCGDYPNRRMFLRLDTPTSTPIISYDVPSTDGHWLPITLLIPFYRRPQGVHDLYFTFEHSKKAAMIALDWFNFVADDAPPRTECPTKKVTCSASQWHIHPANDHEHDDGKITESKMPLNLNINLHF